jgi:hypothetical protein
MKTKEAKKYIWKCRTHGLDAVCICKNKNGEFVGQTD